MDDDFDLFLRKVGIATCAAVVLVIIILAVRGAVSLTEPAHECPAQEQGR